MVLYKVNTIFAMLIKHRDKRNGSSPSATHKGNNEVFDYGS